MSTFHSTDQQALLEAARLLDAYERRPDENGSWAFRLRDLANRLHELHQDPDLLADILAALDVGTHSTDADHALVKRIEVFAKRLKMSLPVRQAVCVYVDSPNGAILAVPRRDGSGFGLPGGKVNAGEELEAAVRRECLEETGYTLCDLKVVCAGQVPPGVGGHSFEVTYFTGHINPRVKRVDAEFEVEWVTPEQLLAGPFGMRLASVLDLIERDRAPG